jgi:2-oxo-4-hydroxy-4-carboxy--5-ureidoimidazoline (OHCU) decarboxylase
LHERGGRRTSSLESRPHPATRERLAAANDYQARFGFIFIVCATGKAPRDVRDRHARWATREDELANRAEGSARSRIALKKLSAT